MGICRQQQLSKNPGKWGVRVGDTTAMHMITVVVVITDWTDMRRPSVETYDEDSAQLV